MEQIIEILTPWAKPFLVFCGFMLIRYLYRTVILRFLQLLNNKMSFEYGGDILDAFAKPIHIFLFYLRRLCCLKLLANYFCYRPSGN